MAEAKLQISLDYRMVCVALLVVIIGMFALWQPWNDPRAELRTVEVTGQATVTAEPDEFVFYPSYQFKNADKQAALAELTAKSNDIVAKLKELGVADSKLKTNSDGYDMPVYLEDKSTPTYTLQITVIVGTKDLAQKVQDYLITTTPSGAVTPQATFSDKKQNEVENQARDEATKDARSKAEQSAKNLGFSLGAVKTVNDAAGFGIYFPTRGFATDSVASAEKLTIQPGENELSYSVSVEYFVR